MLKTSLTVAPTLKPPAFRLLVRQASRAVVGSAYGGRVPGTCGRGPLTDSLWCPGFPTGLLHSGIRATLGLTGAGGQTLGGELAQPFSLLPPLTLAFCPSVLLLQGSELLPGMCASPRLHLNSPEPSSRWLSLWSLL